MYNDIYRMTLKDQIASKRFAYDAVAAMPAHPFKAAALKRIDNELAVLQKQLRG